MEGVSEPDDYVNYIEMPDLEVAGKVQDEDGKGTQPGCKIANCHHEFAIVAVNQDAGERNNEQVWQGEGGGHDAQGCSTAGFLEDPDGKGEAGHAGGENRDCLSDEDNGQAEHTGGAFDGER